jgi:osmoprotectant transport system permease protein
VNWVSNNLDLVLELTVQHLRLAVVPIVLGFVFAIPLGYIAYRYKLTRGILLTVAGLLYTIPSIAMFIVLPTILGISILSEANVVVALTLYAVAIMSRSIAEALASVDPGVRQAATAVGYSSWRRFWTVEFPLAGPVMLAGLRVTAVSTISLVTVGILIGVQSLGYLFTNGYQRRITEEILTGVVAVAVVALLIDFLLARLGRLIMPWTRVTDARGGRRRRGAAVTSAQGASA